MILNKSKRKTPPNKIVFCVLMLLLIYFTNVFFYAGMQQHVRIKTAGITKRFVANTAGVRFLFRVHLLMRQQRRFGRKILTTLTTQKRFLSMRQLMRFQCTFRFVRLIANVTKKFTVLVVFIVIAGFSFFIVVLLGFWKMTFYV